MKKAIHEILIRPILTEKSVINTNLQRYTRADAKKKAGSNTAAVDALVQQTVKKYTFVVALNATKIEIANAVEELYAKEKVKVAAVNTVHVRGKQRRAYTRRGQRPNVGTSPAWKKAVVTLAPDSPTIPMLEGV